MRSNKVFAKFIFAAFILGGFSAGALALEAAGVLKRAERAMGGEELKSIQYSYSGSEFVLGQSFRPGQAWPQWNFELKTISINYETGAWSEALNGSRTREVLPPQGGGDPSGPRGVTFTRDGFAWIQFPQAVGPNPWAVTDRNHQLWTTPHGIVKAAIRNKATLTWQTKGGKSIAAVSFVEPGKFSATAYINEDYLVERIESRFPLTSYGEVSAVTNFADYKDFGSIKFPTRIRQAEGGFPTLDAAVKEVRPNEKMDIEVPDSVRQAATGQKLAAIKAAEGVWFIPGSHNSVAIEMKDHIVVVETPLTTERGKAVFEAARLAIPGKPVKYLINTHHHIDHAGGIRAAVAEGATIVTHQLSAPLYQRYFSARRTLVPDELAAAKKKLLLKTVKDKLVLSDGSRNVEIHHMRGQGHADNMLMVYLPKEKLLIETDAFSPPPANALLAPQNVPLAANLAENIDKLKLAIDRIIPLHGPIVPLSELYRAMGKTK
jgi:glyoxylase-like metal-dependent hydrolase (beta-lactamase superfamily II)